MSECGRDLFVTSITIARDNIDQCVEALLGIHLGFNEFFKAFFIAHKPFFQPLYLLREAFFVTREAFFVCDLVVDDDVNLFFQLVPMTPSRKPTFTKSFATRSKRFRRCSLFMTNFPGADSSRNINRKSCTNSCYALVGFQRLARTIRAKKSATGRWRRFSRPGRRLQLFANWAYRHKPPDRFSGWQSLTTDKDYQN
jgi:hypothetical protein